MPGFGWVSFTTDYGLTDGFVASCHGVIARLAPHARVIDVTHQVPPGGVRPGAALLAQTLPELPAAVHLAVVDPGVGTPRRPVALATPGGVLVGPDNGLLPWAADALGGVDAAVELTNPAWFAPVVSHTFHGRDIFAPVAARLAVDDARLSDAGQPLDPGALVRLPDPVVRAGAGWLEAEVVMVDHFGNVQLAAAAGQWRGLPEQLRVHGPAGDRPAVRGETFADAPTGALVVLVDSAGKVAVAVNGGRAADLLGGVPGEVLRISG